MKTQMLLFVVAALCSSAFTVRAQGTFQNLNFESASLTSGQSGSLVPVASAFPGWSAFYGSAQTSQVLYNNDTLDDVNISLLGPGWAGDPTQPWAVVITGNFTAFLEAGVGTGGLISATLQQTSTIPDGDKSILFYAEGPEVSQYLSVSFASQSLSYVALGAGPNGSEEYGADISALAGQTGTLNFTENPSASEGGFTVALDNITFSTSAIPEPGTWTLLLFGAGMIGVARCAKRKFRA